MEVRSLVHRYGLGRKQCPNPCGRPRHKFKITTVRPISNAFYEKFQTAFPQLVPEMQICVGCKFYMLGHCPKVTPLCSNPCNRTQHSSRLSIISADFVEKYRGRFPQLAGVVGQKLCMTCYFGISGSGVVNKTSRTTRRNIKRSSDGPSNENGTQCVNPCNRARHIDSKVSIISEQFADTYSQHFPKLIGLSGQRICIGCYFYVLNVAETAEQAQETQDQDGSFSNNDVGDNLEEGVSDDDSEEARTSKFCFTCTKPILDYSSSNAPLSENESNCLCRVLNIPLPNFGPKFFDAKFCVECVSRAKETASYFSQLEKIDGNIAGMQKYWERRLRIPISSISLEMDPFLVSLRIEVAEELNLTPREFFDDDEDEDQKPDISLLEIKTENEDNSGDCDDVYNDAIQDSNSNPSSSSFVKRKDRSNASQHSPNRPIYHDDKYYLRKPCPLSRRKPLDQLPYSCSIDGCNRKFYSECASKIHALQHDE